jgi:5-deoxy-glucuronate isomerase
VSARRYLPAGSAARDGHDVSVTAAEAGWKYCGLTVRTLTPGESYTFVSDGFECAVLPLAGGSLTVEADTKRFALDGRETVFARVTDAAYIPLDTEVRIRSAAGCQIALPSARATRRFEPAYIAAGDVSVEPRGAGPATRQVTNFLTPGVFDSCDKLVCCELLTPDGNWSSYPPHRHDGEDTTRFAPKGFGLHRTYTADGAIDDHVSVGDGDVYLVPRGYHGPCVAAPGYPMYYLNVLAGPGDDRTMAFCDDPAHHWVRDTWASMPLDPRVPMTNMNGVVS